MTFGHFLLIKVWVTGARFDLLLLDPLLSILLELSSVVVFEVSDSGLTARVILAMCLDAIPVANVVFFELLHLFFILLLKCELAEL